MLNTERMSLGRRSFGFPTEPVALSQRGLEA